jgi:methionine sulfoxide reductase heme-binding subunit
MRNRTIVFLKIPVWLVCLWPLAKLGYQAITGNLGADPTHTVTFATGDAAIWMLVLSLAISPVRRLVPGLSWLIRFRRLIGLFAFFYASLHLLTYVGLYAYFDPHTIATDVMKRRYVFVGMSAWLLLSLLALTSTTWSIRKLGGKRWQALHRLVYAAAVLAITHFWWLVKPGVLKPLNLTLLLAVLLAARPVIGWAKRKPRQPDLLKHTTAS